PPEGQTHICLTAQPRRGAAGPSGHRAPAVLGTRTDPVAERSHARAQPVDRDPVRPWHDPSDLTYVDFVRSAMYQFDISARHLVGHAQRPGDDARTIGRPRAGHPGPAARRTPARLRAAQAAQRHAGDRARAVVRIAVPRAEVADGG